LQLRLPVQSLSCTYSDAASTFLRVDCGLGPPVLILPLSYTKSRALSSGLITTTGIPSKASHSSRA